MRNFAGPRALYTSPFGLLTLALIAALAVGCGQDSKPGSSTAPAPETSEPATGKAPAPPPAPEAAPKAAVVQGKLPSDYPSDLPQYPGATARDSLGIPGAAMMVTWDSGDAVGDIATYLEDELEKNGWSVHSGDTGKIEATKGERTAKFRVNPAATGGGSKIAVTVTGG